MWVVDTRDMVFFALGLLTAIWCAGLTVIAVWSDSRHRTDALGRVTASFFQLLLKLHKQS